jgi:predicted dehydrogenase
LPNAGCGFSLIGAGAFGQGILLPAMKKIPGITMRGIVTAGGVSARAGGDRFGFAFCASDPDEVFADESTAGVLIATRHDQHAALVGRAIAAGKAVLVEKPLALSIVELESVVAAVNLAQLAGTTPLVMVGFNRRFSPMVRTVLEWRQSIAGPVTINYRINAGRLPAGSWIADPVEGGGRLLGEVCHFVDLCSVFAGAPIAEVFAHAGAGSSADDLAITLKCTDGSLASITYASSGARSFSKERIELFGGESVAVIDDFRTGSVVTNGSRRCLGGWLTAQDKGHAAELSAFVDAVRTGGPSPVPFDSAVHVTRATLALLSSRDCGEPIAL